MNDLVSAHTQLLFVLLMLLSTIQTVVTIFGALGTAKCAFSNPVKICHIQTALMPPHSRSVLICLPNICTSCGQSKQLSITMPNGMRNRAFMTRHLYN